MGVIKKGIKQTIQIADNLRNVVVASFAELKIFDIQWKNLCEGFIS